MRDGLLFEAGTRRIQKKSQKSVYLKLQKSQKSVCLHHQKSQKGAKTTMKRKIYQQLLEWKNKRQELHFVFVDKMHEKIW